jgi:hypothetical protein
MTAADFLERPIVVDLMFKPHAVPLASASSERVAGRLQGLQGARAKLAAEEAELILRLAELRPVDGDPAPDHPGAKRRGWSPHEEHDGVSEFFLDELAMVLNVGRGTAAFRARRAFCWRDKLPRTFAALKRGEIDERRAQELFTVVEHIATELAPPKTGARRSRNPRTCSSRTRATGCPPSARTCPVTRPPRPGS